MKIAEIAEIAEASRVSCKMSEAPAPVLGSEEATELDMPEVKIIKFYLYQIKIY